MNETMMLCDAMRMFQALRVDDIVRITTQDEDIWVEFIPNEGTPATHYRLTVNLWTGTASLENLDDKVRYSIVES